MIRINADWVIDADDFNYILKRDLHKKGKPKKDSDEEIDLYKVAGYFSTLESALERVGEEMFRDVVKDGENSLVRACTAIREARDTWKSLVDEVMKAEGREHT